MLRTISAFYLTSMALAFAIALWLAVQDMHPSQILIAAMTAWPTAALLLLARKKVAALRLG